MRERERGWRLRSRPQDRQDFLRVSSEGWGCGDSVLIRGPFGREVHAFLRRFSVGEHDISVLVIMGTIVVPISKQTCTWHWRDRSYPLSLLSKASMGATDRASDYLLTSVCTRHTAQPPSSNDSGDTALSDVGINLESTSDMGSGSVCVEIADSVEENEESPISIKGRPGPRVCNRVCHITFVQDHNRGWTRNRRARSLSRSFGISP